MEVVDHVSGRGAPELAKSQRRVREHGEGVPEIAPADHLATEEGQTYFLPGLLGQGEAIIRIRSLIPPCVPVTLAHGL